MKDFFKLAAIAQADGHMQELTRVQGFTPEAAKKAYTKLYSSRSRSKDLEACGTALKNACDKFKAVAV